MKLLLIRILRRGLIKMKLYLKKIKCVVTDKIDKIIDNSIQSICSPQVFSIIIPLVFGTCYHQNIIDTITNTQAKILLQKENLDLLQYQITETWIATSPLLFLLREYDKSNRKKENQKSINSAYNYWKHITENWKNKWQSKFNANLSQNKKNKTKLSEQFDDIVNYFETEFFIRLSVCYEKYYSKNKSCITPKRTLPLPANVNEYQNNKIYSFYITKSQEK